MNGWLAVGVAGALLLAACSGDDQPGASPAADTGVATDVGAAGDVAGLDVASDAAAGPDTKGPPATGDGIFLEGCPVPGAAYAKQIAHPDARMHGPDVLGGPGDWLLMNERAAFVISDPGYRKTYWYYDGILIDAVAVDGCAQAGEERFEELVPLVAAVDFGDFISSAFRGFHPETIEVLADGSDGGDAIVRATGRDDLFWLIDQVFAVASYLGGGDRGLSQPLGIAMWVDYILSPGASALRIEIGLRNLDAEPKELGAALALWFGDTTTPWHHHDTELSISGYTVDLGTPWFGAASQEGDGASAIGLAEGTAGTLNISGVQAFFDVDQVFDKPRLGPAGAADDSRRWDFFVAVGATDGNSATRELVAATGGRISGQDATLEPVSGVIVDAVDGAPVPAATVRVELANSDGDWRPFDRLRADAEGRFDAQLTAFGGAKPTFRLRADQAGRPPSEPVDVTVPATAPATLTLGRAATLQLDIRDPGGKGLPARVMLYDASNGALRSRYHSVTGGEALPVAPGTYDVSVLRGIEYTFSEQTVTLVADETLTLSATLERVVDTTGFLLMDSHVHGGPSADSRIVVDQRVRTAAAEGCEVPVNTDHEFILDYQPSVVTQGLTEWVRAVTGEEVTPTVPEHINIFPVAPDLLEDARGGIVKWYGLDLGQIYAAIDDRGAGITQLNHPRHGCNYLCLIGWDWILGQPTFFVDDPTLLGLPADAELWSWNFDAIELVNGMSDIWLNPSRPEETGLFEDWQSFLNHGHKITALGVTDTHSITAPCHPGTYFASSTDEPAQLDEGELVDSVVAGRAVITTGAFARVSVNGAAGLGDTVTDGDGAVDVSVHIEALPQIDVTHFKVMVNCDQAATVATTAPGEVVKYDGTVSVPVTQDAHVVVMGFGAQPLPRGFRNANAARVARFITNAIYVDADGDGDFDAPGGKTCSYDLAGP